MTGLVTTSGAEFLALIERDVPLKLAASTNGGEYAGPCPFCQEGEDRFRVWPQHPDHGGKGRFWCRVCDLSGDAGDYVKYRDGLESDRAALEVLGALEGANNAAPSKPRRGNGHRSRQSRPRAKIGPIVGEYLYRDATGAPVMRVTRHEPKTFRQWRPDGTGGWSPGIKGIEPVLFNLPEVLEVVDRGDVVWIVEGEKSVEALRQKAKTATTSPMGAGNWRDAYGEPLRGAHVAILPDNDEPGRKHAQAVARSLQGVAASVKVVELPGLDEGQDVVDWIAAGGTSADLHVLYRDAYEWEPSAASDGLHFKWLTPAQVKALPPLEYLIDDKLPKQSLIMLYGQSGTMKTFKALDWAARVADDAPVLYVVTEGEGGFGRRLEAWEKHHRRPVADQLLQLHDSIDLMDVEAVLALIRDALFIRPGLIIFDTLVNCAVGADENGSRDMSQVIAACKQIQRETGASVLLVHHSTKEGRWERGSSALRAAMDVMIEMSEANGVVTMRCTKTKDAEVFAEQRFKLVKVADTDSCVLLPTDQVALEFDTDLTPTETRVLEVLSQAIYREAGCSWKRLIDETKASAGALSGALSRLKNFKMIRQADRGEPYYVTAEGMAAIGRERSESTSQKELL